MFNRIGISLLLASVGISLAVFSYARQAEMGSAGYEFRELTSESVESIQRRLASYGQVVSGVASYMSVAESVPLEDYNEYIEGLDLDDRLQGIRGVAYIRSISSAAVPFLEIGLSEQYDRQISVYPDTGNAERFVLSRIAPLEGNEAAIGLDMSFEDGRTKALLTARETNEMQMTSRVALVQDAESQVGFILVRAIFADQHTGASGARRNGDFLGWIGGAFVLSDLLEGTTQSMGRDFELRVYDSPERRPENLVFYTGPETAVEGDFNQSFDLPVNGQSLYLRYTSTPAFDEMNSSYLPHLMAIVGLLVTVLIGLALSYFSLRSRALAQIAETRARQLGAREDENRSLLDTTMSGVLILDATGKIRFANAAAAELFGTGADGFEGRELSEFVALKPGRYSQEGFNAEGLSRKGERLYLDVETNGWRTANGEERVTAIVRNVTEMIHARLETDKVRQRYDTALDGAEIGIFEIDLATGTSIVSETWHKIMNTREKDTPFDHQREFMSRVHPEDLPDLIEADRRCIEGETSRSKCEYRMSFGDEWRWMYSDAVAIERDENGRGTRLVGTQTDVTSIRHARNALEVSEERFRIVLQDAPVGMALLDKDGRFLDVNTALAKLSGYTKYELLNERRLSDLLGEEDFARMSGEVAELVTSGSSATFQAQGSLTTRSEETRWGLINVSWTYDKNRTEYVYIAQIVDITDQKKLEQIKSEFVATVSHELRTPLTSIKGALALLDATQAKQFDASANRLLEIARTNADRLTTIVNDILDLEKISSGEVVFEIENASLGDIAAAAISEMQPFALGHQNTLTLDAPHGDIVVRVDANRTSQVLANLISNACKYSDPDTPVTLRYERLETEAIVFVSNIGPGIPESFRDQIFDAFTQLDGSDTRSKGGTGLGLNITRQIVFRQSGRIGFESARNGLTVFWFTMPLVNVDALVSREEAPAPKTLPGRMQRVLHVEDDLDFAEVIRAGVGDSADMVHAYSLAAAHLMVGEGKWDVIVIDWTLPDGDGRSLLNEIEAKQPDARVIVLTAVANGKSEDPRIDVTLIKSQVEIDDIVDTIRSAGAGTRAAE